MSSINVILDEIDELGIEDQEYVVEVVNNRLRDKRRGELAERAREAMHNVEIGNVKSGGFEDLWADLND